jgi:FkbM family methyltransferase
MLTVRTVKVGRPIRQRFWWLWGRTYFMNKNAVVSKFKDILRPYKRRISVLSWNKSLRTLQRLGFEPKSVFDIGVAYGTWELYAIYPKAFYFLTDPVKEAFPHIEKIRNYLKKCQFDAVALSDEDGTAMFDIRGDIQGSTMMENVGPADTIRHEKVITRRFDSLYPTFPTPALVKIDVQGSELMVLRGMEKSLEKIDAALIEVSILSTTNSPEAHEIINYMWDHGFVIADVLGVLRRPFDGQASQMDLLFIKDESEFRRDRRWA